MARLFVFLTGCVWANPSSFVCNDPRFDPGSKIMGMVPTASSTLKLSASSGSYTAGSSVDITFSHPNTGHYVALRALPKYGYVGQYGVFDALSTNLEHTEGSCPNTVFSSFAVSSGSLTWTAHKDTYGPVEITLIAGNQMTLYTKTITLEGPPVPKVAPALQRERQNATSAVQTRAQPALHSATGLQPGPPSECIAASNYNLPNAPVFVQKLRSRSITFPAGQCLSCRGDFADHCSSAMVMCPSEPGMLATQSLFDSDNCSGVPSTSLVPTDIAHCPGPDHYSPDTLDLSRFISKLQRDHSSYFPSSEAAERAIAEYKRFLHIIQRYPDSPAVPSKLVDLVWHEHILDTQAYRMDSQRLFGKYVHHGPSFGDEDDESVKAEKQEMVEQQQEMLERYAEMFGESPSLSMWPQAGVSPQMGAGRLPDCCKADCVKVDCVTCVGCNAVYCGKLQETPMPRPRVQHAHPDEFAGYVPHLKPIAEASLGARQVSYLCEATPLPGMQLSWTISGSYIYLRQTLSTSIADTWHGVGFTDVAPYDMGYADFIVSIFAGNYTGIRDLYKYDAGNHYPCWDVLTQCSLNGKAGTMDLIDRAVERKNGVSTSTWTRLLDTGDSKDKVIKDSLQKVMFAHGVDDQFTYHPSDKRITCDVNFFSGTVRCGGPAHAVQAVV